LKKRRRGRGGKLGKGKRRTFNLASPRLRVARKKKVAKGGSLLKKRKQEEDEEESLQRGGRYKKLISHRQQKGESGMNQWRERAVRHGGGVRGKEIRKKER